MDGHRPGVRRPSWAGPPSRRVRGGEARVSQELVHLEVTGGIATGTLDSPATRNPPSRARVNGSPRAGGIGLVAACDIAISVDGATFAFSEVRLGLIPAIISVVVLPKLGITKGMELFLTGDTFAAREAVEFGLLNAAVPAAPLA